ncbi:MAG: sorbosone dehydrogenase family protein [Candidatus Schekmanbacteria bacterium]|nr:sorbosone dehydrogenase family protein [Candidatus Schekmanbacteria bacterium]
MRVVNRSGPRTADAGSERQHLTGRARRRQYGSIARHLACGWLLFASACSAPLQTPTPKAPIHLIRLPAGFQISEFARGLPGARSLTLGTAGTVFVGTRGRRVYAVRDADGDGFAELKWIIADELHSPNGVAFREGALYVAEISRVIRFADIERRLDAPPAATVVRADYPTSEHHGWKFIRFGPDGLLYVPVGAPCNVCQSDDRRFAAITRMDPEGKTVEVFAEGIRNTVGFDWHPVTGELWFTDNGRDQLGDDAPPDELNHAPTPGLHFGFPYCHGGDIPDPELGNATSCSQFRPPAQRLGAHVASLGMRFYRGTSFPAVHHGQVFIAEHGSWNRSTPSGYRIAEVRLEGNKAVSYAVFAEGWLQGADAWGRPVDIEILPDGSMLISDDKAGVLYRVAYAEEPPK